MKMEMYFVTWKNHNPALTLLSQDKLHCLFVHWCDRVSRSAKERKWSSLEWCSMSGVTRPILRGLNTPYPSLIFNSALFFFIIDVYPNHAKCVKFATHLHCNTLKTVCLYNNFHAKCPSYKDWQLHLMVDGQSLPLHAKFTNFSVWEVSQLFFSARCLCLFLNIVLFEVSVCWQGIFLKCMHYWVSIGLDTFFLYTLFVTCPDVMVFYVAVSLCWFHGCA